MWGKMTPQLRIRGLNFLFQVPIVSGGPTDSPSGELATQRQSRDKEFSSPSDSSEFQLFHLVDVWPWSKYKITISVVIIKCL